MSPATCQLLHHFPLAGWVANSASSAEALALVVYRDRHDGNTELLARRAAEHLPAQSVQLWLHLMDLPLEPFREIRHSIGVYLEPRRNERTLFDATI
jgi:hypothetical protein